VTRHLRELRAADFYRALGLAALSVLVGKRREVSTRILFEFFLQLSQPVVVHDPSCGLRFLVRLTIPRTAYA